MNYYSEWLQNKVSQFRLIKTKISNLIENVSNNRAH